MALLLLFSLAMSTAQVFIFEILRENGLLQCPPTYFASINQLVAFCQCKKFASLYGGQFTERDFDLSLTTGRMHFEKVLTELFETGVTLGRVIAMYVYAGTYAVRFLKCNVPEICFVLPDWVDDYVRTYLKPRLISSNRWEAYEKLFNLSM